MVGEIRFLVYNYFYNLHDTLVTESHKKGKWNSRKREWEAGTENGNGNSQNSLQTINLPLDPLQ